MPDLSAMLSDLAGTPEGIDLGRVRARVARRRHRRRLTRIGVAAGALLLVVGGLTFAASHDQDDRPLHVVGRPDAITSSTVASTRPPAGQKVAVEDLGNGWQRFGPWPLDTDPGINGIGREGVSTVWTGRELILWGGSTDGRGWHDDGAALNPETHVWRKLPPSPLTGRVTETAVWTGSEMIIWGGANASDGAAYDPASNEWRSLAEAPIYGAIGYTAVWTGNEMVVIAGAEGTSRNKAAAYDPAADSWRRLPDAPVGLNFGDALWTGQEVLLVGGQRFDSGGFSNLRGEVIVASFDPASSRWRTIPRSGISAQSATGAWIDGELLVITYTPRSDGSRSWVRSRDAWEDRPSFPAEGCESVPVLVPAGGRVFGGLCGIVATYDPTARTWTSVPLPASRPDGLGLGQAFWTGTSLIIARGDREVLSYTPG